MDDLLKGFTCSQSVVSIISFILKLHFQRTRLIYEIFDREYLEGIWRLCEGCLEGMFGKVMKTFWAEIFFHSISTQILAKLSQVSWLAQLALISFDPTTHPQIPTPSINNLRTITIPWTVTNPKMKIYPWPSIMTFFVLVQCVVQCV